MVATPGQTAASEAAPVRPMHLPMDARTWLGLEPRPQPGALGAARHAGHLDSRAVPVRRVRAGRGHRRHGGDVRPASGVGHRAVPVVCQPAVGARHRRDHPRPGSEHHPGPGGRPRRRDRDPDRQRGARQPRHGRRGPGSSPRWCPARGLPGAGPRVPGIESIMDRIDVRLADASGWDELDGNPAPGGRSPLWARMPDLLDPLSGASRPSSATTCPSASARRSA